jgi:hypothetical protein
MSEWTDWRRARLLNICFSTVKKTDENFNKRAQGTAAPEHAYLTKVTQVEMGIINRCNRKIMSSLYR